MTKTDEIETLANLDLSLSYVLQARELLLKLRLPVALECCYLTSTADTLRKLRAESWRNRKLPPDPDGQNDDRATWAGKAIAAFRRETGTDEEDALGDLLADLMHWSDRNDYDFELALDRGRWHYQAETQGGEQ